MNQNLEKFSQILENEHKEEAVDFALELLKNGTVDIVTLYSDILTPALNNMKCSLADENICIWKEHIRTAIVRTIVECCYPYVIAERDKNYSINRGNVVVICPPEEHHELGARIVADFFTICGYHAVFVGSNTPYHDFYNAASKINPDIIAISVSNYYNLVITKKIIKELRSKTNPKTKIVVGGHAFLENSQNISLVGADYFANTFDDIKNIVERENTI